jgi:hypothetical protein
MVVLEEVGLVVDALMQGYGSRARLSWLARRL